MGTTVPPKHFLHNNRDYTVVQSADFPAGFRRAHEAAYTRFAEEFEFNGPVAFHYAVVEDAEMDISISGEKHMMHISKRDAAKTGEAQLRMATGRALHENFHIYQMAYAAPSFSRAGGDLGETWHFKGPRWWGEGTAEWVALVYPGLSGLKGDAKDELGVRDRIRERSQEYREKRAASRDERGGPVTIAQTLSRNLDENPEWKYVEAGPQSQDLYRSHVYFGGLCAVDFLLGHALDRTAFDRLMAVFPAIEAEDDWERAFLGWSGHTSMATFYEAFDSYVVAGSTPRSKL
jgi:hypothetical protein